MTTSFRILSVPPVPEVPEPVRGRTVAAVDGIALVDEQTAAELLAPLRAAAPPIIDVWSAMPAAAALRVHGDPEPPMPGLSRTCTLGQLDDAALDAFLAVTGEGSGSPLLMAELRQLGGALAQAPAGAGVTGAIPGAFVFYGVGVPATPELAEAIPARTDTIVETMRPWSTGRQTLNFVERDGAAGDVYDPAPYARLAQTRRRWDPRRRFLTSHAIV